MTTTLPAAVDNFGTRYAGRSVTDGTISAGSATLSSATAVFSSADVGRGVLVSGAGIAGTTLTTTIASFTSSTIVGLAQGATVTVAGAAVTIGELVTAAMIQNLQDGLSATERYLAEPALFDVVAHGGVGDGATDDGPAMRAAYAALVAANGGTLRFSAGRTYYCNTPGVASAIPITRDNSKTRGLTRILIEPGATIKLSANTPRFIDFNRVADYDTFYNLRIDGGGTIDCNSIAGRHHVLIGTYKAGGVDQRINIDRITIENIRGINAPVSDTDINPGSGASRTWVFLMLSQAAAGEGTQNTLTNIRIRNCDFRGGNAQVTMGGTSSVIQSGYNMFCDYLWVEDCVFDMGATPVRNNGSGQTNIQIGSLASVGHAWVSRCICKNSADDGIEIDGVQHCVVTDCVVYDCYVACYEGANFNAVHPSTVIFRGCKAVYTSALTAAWTAFDICERLGIWMARVVVADDYDRVVIEDFEYHLAGSTAAMATLGVSFGSLQPIALSAVRNAVVRNVWINITGFSWNNTAGTFHSIGALYVAPYQTALVSVEDVRVHVDGNKVGGTPAGHIIGFWANSSGGSGAGVDVTYHVNGWDQEWAITGAAMASEVWIADMGAGSAPTSGVHTIRGHFNGLRIRSSSGDSAPFGILFGQTTQCAYPSGFWLEHDDFSGVAAGTEIAPQSPVSAKIYTAFNTYATATGILAASGITPTGSPFTYTNTSFTTQTVGISGGTVSLVQLAGDGTTFTTIAAGTNVTVPLDPGAAVKVTYTGAPVMNAVPRR